MPCPSLFANSLFPFDETQRKPWKTTVTITSSQITTSARCCPTDRCGARWRPRQKKRWRPSPHCTIRWPMRCLTTTSPRRRPTGFDRVIANPPFHQGVGEVACQFMRDAARVLRHDGRFFLVANRFLRYGDLIRETFGDVSTAYADGRYHVLTAVARKSNSG